MAIERLDGERRERQLGDVRDGARPAVRRLRPDAFREDPGGALPDGRVPARVGGQQRPRRPRVHVEIGDAGAPEAAQARRPCRAAADDHLRRVPRRARHVVSAHEGAQLLAHPHASAHQERERATSTCARLGRPSLHRFAGERPPGVREQSPPHSRRRAPVGGPRPRLREGVGENGGPPVVHRAYRGRRPRARVDGERDAPVGVHLRREPLERGLDPRRAPPRPSGPHDDALRLEEVDGLPLQPFPLEPRLLREAPEHLRASHALVARHLRKQQRPAPALAHHGDAMDTQLHLVGCRLGVHEARAADPRDLRHDLVPLPGSHPPLRSGRPSTRTARRRPARGALPAAPRPVPKQPQSLPFA